MLVKKVDFIHGLGKGKATDFRDWAFFHLLAKVDGKFPYDEVVNKDELDITLTIHGVEVPFLEIIDDMEAQFDAIVDKTASEKLRNLQNDLLWKLNMAIETQTKEFLQENNLPQDD